MLKSILGFAVILLLTGCGVSKKCIAPEIELPEKIVESMEMDSLSVADIEWSKIYIDTTMAKIIEKTLAYNKDMLAATARLEELAQLHRVAKKNLLPSVSANGSITHETEDYTTNSSVSVTNTVNAVATLSWELDFFGNLRWGNKKALATYFESMENRRALRISLIAEAAVAYIELVALDKEYEIVCQTLRTRKENLKQAELRFKGGLTNEIPYQQAQVEYANTATLVPDLEKRIKMKENEIALLCGEFPTAIERKEIQMSSIPEGMLDLGLPSDLVRRRPDIRAAEQSLKAAMATAGMAWADRFPRFTFSLTGGFENKEFSGFFTSPYSSLVGKIASPIFAFGKKQAQYKATLKAYDAARFGYEKKVLQAFKEVNDAVVQFSSAKETATLTAKLQESSKKYVDISQFQHINGYVNYINVLDAQRSLFNAEIQRLRAVRDELIALVNLYKALGGGIY